MSDSGYSKWACPCCGGHVEYPSAKSGTLIGCPHCGKAIILPHNTVDDAASNASPVLIPKKSICSPWLRIIAGVLMFLFLVLAAYALYRLGCEDSITLWMTTFVVSLVLFGVCLIIAGDMAYEGYDRPKPTRPKPASPPTTTQKTGAREWAVLFAALALIVEITVLYYETHVPPPAVTQSSWDGSVSQVKDWMKANANDPSSLEFVKWSLRKMANGNFDVLCEYRAKNGFGALMIYYGEFVLDANGKVIEANPDSDVRF